MGCGGSKQEVAAEATITVPRPSTEKPVPAAAVHPSAPAPPTADVKDIAVAPEEAAAPAAEREGSAPGEESDAAAAAGQYFSPRAEPHGEEMAPPPAAEAAAPPADGADAAAAVAVGYGSVVSGSFPMGQTGAQVM